MSVPADVKRLLLVGFMGSGKSTVGSLLAARLGWRFFDFDATIEAEEGATVSEIFRTQGEAYFRSAELRVAGRLLALERVVLGSGGGWGASAERLGATPPGTLSVWLRVSAREAVRRAAAAGDARPLLVGPDPLARARELLGQRLRGYAAADLGVDTDGRTPEDVTERILASVRDPETTWHPAGTR
jgi:shikimate kinase